MKHLKKRLTVSKRSRCSNRLANKKTRFRLNPQVAVQDELASEEPAGGEEGDVLDEAPPEPEPEVEAPRLSRKEIEIDFCLYNHEGPVIAPLKSRVDEIAKKETVRKTPECSDVNPNKLAMPRFAISLISHPLLGKRTLVSQVFRIEFVELADWCSILDCLHTLFLKVESVFLLNVDFAVQRLLEI